MQQQQLLIDVFEKFYATFVDAFRDLQLTVNSFRNTIFSQDHAIVQERYKNFATTLKMEINREIFRTAKQHSPPQVYQKHSAIGYMTLNEQKHFIYFYIYGRGGSWEILLVTFSLAPGIALKLLSVCLVSGVVIPVIPILSYPCNICFERC